jgi:hypothetical protein
MGYEPRNGAAAATPAGAAPKAVLLAAGVGLALAVVVAFWFLLSPPAPREEPPGPAPAASDDPRLTYRGRYQNVHPSVGYVGDAACAKCHKPIANAFHRHPMARTLQPVGQREPMERFGASAHNPFEALGAHFRVERAGADLWHRVRWRGADGQPVAGLDLQVRYVLGSGARGRAYLLERDGYVSESPVSWFSHKKIWDSSPGFSAEEHGGRPITRECLFCHANRVTPREGYRNRYETPLLPLGSGIGCESCHGPGRRHVESGGADFTIVSPAHLEPSLREAVCQQCHLKGAARVTRPGRKPLDFRPGLPLEEFWTVFVHASAGPSRKTASHVEQMYQSLCFQRSSAKGKLGCISCHDPHRVIEPERRVGFYRHRCLKCHQEHGCSQPEAERRKQEPQDSCIACHMPRYKTLNLVHVADTDHTVVRHRDKMGADPYKPRGPRAGIDLVDFHRKGSGGQDKEGIRALGIALVTLAAEEEALAPVASQRAVELLERALEFFPEDAAVWESKAHALWMLRRPAEALASFQAALARGPERERSLVGAAQMSVVLGQGEAAVGYWRRAVKLNPWDPSYRQQMVDLLKGKGPSHELSEECRAWLKLDPGSAAARKAWVECLLGEGKKAEARAEFARLEALRPPNLPELRAWFKKHLP